MSNREEMEEQTNFLKMINEAESSLDAFVARGRIFELSREAIISAVRGPGVVLPTASAANDNLQTLAKKFQGSSFPGSFEVRWL